MNKTGSSCIIGAAIVLAGLLTVCSIAVAAPHNDADDLKAQAQEPATVSELRRSVVEGPYGKMGIRSLVDELIRGKGPPLQQVYLALTLRKQEAVPIILEKLETGGPAVKRKVTKFLRYGRWPEAVPKLLEVASLDDEHEISRIGALYALGAIGKKSTGPAILALIDKPRPGATERRIIIATLARLRYRAAIPKIEPYLRHENLLVRIFAARALAEFGQRPDAQFLFEALSDKDFVVREAACGALGSYGGSDAAVEYLREMTENDPVQSVRQEARVSLLRMEAADMNEAERARFLEPLIGRPEKKVRAWAIDSLALECGRQGQTILRESISIHHREEQKIAFYLLALSNIANNPEEGS
jgi:HEAT repeat protein